MLILWIVPCSAQDTATVVRLTDSGEPIFSWHGQEFRGLTRQHADELNNKLQELSKLQEAMPVALSLNETRKQQIDILTQKSELLVQESRSKDSIIANWKLMFNEEHQLLLSAEKFVYKPGRITQLFNNPLLQLGLKIGVPAVQMMRCN